MDINNISNLSLIPRHKHSSNDSGRIKFVKFTCAWCDKEFESSTSLVRDRAKKNKADPFCSRDCADKYSPKPQLNLILNLV